MPGAENINDGSKQPAGENEAMDTIPSEVDLGLTWTGKTFSFQLWGDAKNRTAYNDVDENARDFIFLPERVIYCSR